MLKKVYRGIQCCAGRMHEETTTPLNTKTRVKLSNVKQDIETGKKLFYLLISYHQCSEYS